jgi:hypothetical protein
MEELETGELMGPGETAREEPIAAVSMETCS